MLRTTTNASNYEVLVVTNLLFQHIKSLQSLTITFPDTLSVPLVDLRHKPFFHPPLANEGFEALSCLSLTCPHCLVCCSQRTGVASDVQLINTICSSKNRAA